MAESKHVFVAASGAAAAASMGRSLRILEIGLGTGLNFLLTADLFAANRSALRYVSVEHRPLPVNLLAQLRYDRWLTTPTLWRFWLAAADRLVRDGTVANTFAGLSFEACVGDAVAELPTGTFDIVYLDAFSPTTNPHPWSRTALAAYRSRLAAGGTLVTYSAQGELRRNLTALGFQVSRKPGPAGKREMLLAVKPS